MQIKNYTSSVDPGKSARKIEDLLQQRGVERIMRISDDGEIEELRAQMTEPKSGQIVNIRIAPDLEATRRAFEQYSKAPNNPSDEQVRRTAWKNEYEFIHLCMTQRAGESPVRLLMDRIVTQTDDSLYDALFSEEAAPQRRKLLPGA